MKKFKKIIALLVAAVMILSINISAFAADEFDSPLTITGLTDGDVAHFYQVIKWAPDDENNVGGWIATDAFASVLTKAKLTEVLLGTPDDPDTVEDETVAPTGITSELAGQLAKLATSGATDVTAASGQAAYTNEEPGLWMAIITPIEADTVYNPVFVASDYKEGGNTWAVTENATYADEAAAKKSTVSIDKTATVTEDNWDDAKWTTVAIGDTVSYNVKTTIPGYGEVYESPVFKITDKLTDLTLVTDSVTLVAPTGLTKGTDYTLTPTATGYTIEFAADYLKTLTTPTDVEVTYDAIVSTTAPVHVNTEKNEVSTEFSHNPSDESDHGFKKDTTQHYTFTIDANGLGSTEEGSGKRTSEIVKVALDANGNPVYEKTITSEIYSSSTYQSPLEGAEFKLYTDAGCTTEYVPKKNDGTAGDPLVITTDADGRMTITGLDAGTYYLKETQAPAGFIKDQTAHKIEIIAETDEVEVTEYTTDGVNWSTTATGAEGEKSYTYKTDVLKSYTIKIDGEETATYNFTNDGTDAVIDWTDEPPVEVPSQIVNTQGLELPSTGGIGTTIFYILGGILVIGAGVVLVTRRRMNAQ